MPTNSISYTPSIYSTHPNLVLVFCVSTISYNTLHNSIPPTFLSTHSLASKIPLSVLINIHSPGFVSPFTNPASLPRTIFPRPSTSIQIRFVGLLTILIWLNTGSLFQYFKPSHNRRVLIFSCVTGSGTYVDRASKGGGVIPPRTTVERKPEVCSASVSRRIMLEEGTDVKPRRALEAFWRCEHTFERWTSDIVRYGASDSS